MGFYELLYVQTAASITSSSACFAWLFLTHLNTAKNSISEKGKGEKKYAGMLPCTIQKKAGDTIFTREIAMGHGWQLRTAISYEKEIEGNAITAILLRAAIPRRK